jgi:hypothetical protein
MQGDSRRRGGDPVACQRASAARSWLDERRFANGRPIDRSVLRCIDVPREPSRHPGSRLRPGLCARRWNRRGSLSEGDDLPVRERLVPRDRLQGRARRRLHSVSPVRLGDLRYDRSLEAVATTRRAPRTLRAVKIAAIFALACNPRALETDGGRTVTLGSDAAAPVSDASAPASDGGAPAVEAGPTCSPVCGLGYAQCSGDGLMTCVVGPAGCPVFGPSVPCGPNTHCCSTCGQSSICLQDPSCPAVPAACNGNGTFCLDAHTVATCAVTRPAASTIFPCSDVVNQAACPPGQTCVDSPPLQAACR